MRVETQKGLCGIESRHRKKCSQQKRGQITRPRDKTVRVHTCSLDRRQFHVLLQDEIYKCKIIK
jgi:hypothetical protein